MIGHIIQEHHRSYRNTDSTVVFTAFFTTGRYFFTKIILFFFLQQ